MIREIFFNFKMWPPLSGGYLHCRLGAIQIRHHGAICMGGEIMTFCSCQYTHVVLTHPVFLGRTTHYRVSWFTSHLCSHMNSIRSNFGQPLRMLISSTVVPVILMKKKVGHQLLLQCIAWCIKYTILSYLKLIFNEFSAAVVLQNMHNMLHKANQANL